ncbi:MAG: hypothetical protein JST11_16410 [Acidobacteria bacterium]|nr:hypothetical protein [Acidobacteriota bacterium]
MKRAIFSTSAFLGSLLAMASLPQAYGQPGRPTPYAFPAGVFGKVDIETAKKTCTPQSNGTTNYKECLHTIFEQMFQNNFVSGLTVGERWDNIEPSVLACGYPEASATCDPGETQWLYLDDAVNVAKEHGGNVELDLTPGLNTPLWVLSRMGPSCDNVLIPGVAPPPHDCGWVTVTKFQQPRHADSKYLPMPWNSVYRSYWKDFLRRVRDRYITVPNSPVVAIAVTGPNAASNEIIYPTSDSGGLIGPKPGVDADTAWALLFRNAFPGKGSDYWGSDQAIVKAWTDAIDDYESIFSGVTLVISPDAGNFLPELPTPALDTSLNGLECASSKLPYSCAAKTNIISYFLYDYQLAPNAKATRVGGMTATSPVSAANSKNGIGIGGVKLLTPTPLPLPLKPAAPLLGGAQFDHPISQGKHIQQTGCPTYPNKKCDNLTPEEAAFSVLSVFFHGTPAAKMWGGINGWCEGVIGPSPAPVHFVEVSFLDVQNAESETTPQPGSTIPGIPPGTKLRDLFRQANADLLAMAHGTPIPPTCH